VLRLREPVQQALVGVAQKHELKVTATLSRKVVEPSTDGHFEAWLAASLSCGRLEIRPHQRVYAIGAGGLDQCITTSTVGS
jgi:hypothetical protein